LRRSTGCRIFNLQMAGYASAAAEEGLAFAGLAQLTEAVSKRGLLRTTGFDFDEALDASLTGVLGGIRTPHPG
jgi:hypothetical protein